MNDKLKAARLARNMTQMQVALACQVDTKRYGQWEREEAKPGPRNIEKLCTFFGMTQDELGYAEDKYPINEKQLKCLQYVAYGNSSRQIAHMLAMTPNTVDNHINRACRALGVSGRDRAVEYAKKEGWIK